jgi:hypothetical protein
MRHSIATRERLSAGGVGIDATTTDQVNHVRPLRDRTTTGPLQGPEELGALGGRIVTRALNG